jgi:GT2 family glycosyltransferase
MTMKVPNDESRLGDFPSVCCVLLNWNGWKDTVACLHSLALQSYPDLHIVVVDNASTNESVFQIQKSFPDVEVISAHANLGFSGGCNIGIRRALAMEAQLIWLLNNDTIAPPNTLQLLVEATHSRVGVTGSVLRHLDHPEVIQAWGGGRLRLWSGYVTHFTAPTLLGPHSYLTFASVLIRREVLLEVGLMDEHFFMYFEDADFCFRVRDAGWELAVAPDTAILHKEGGSLDGKKSPLMERIVTASGLRFLQIHASTPIIAMVFFLLSKVAKRLVIGNFTGLNAVALGASDWWRKRLTPFQGGS